MTQTTTSPTVARPVATDLTSAARRRLLGAGLVAGPLFVGLAILQAVLRPGFDIRRHAVSALSVGDGGWIQVAVFVSTGLLMLAFAIGSRAALGSGRGATWGPRFLGLFGLGLVGAGVFVTDPAFGFPPGAPDGMPAAFSWHASLHAAAFMVSFGALVIAAIILARRFAGDGRRSWAAYSLGTAAVSLALSAWPPSDGAASIRYALAAVVAWAWVTLLAVELRRATTPTPHRSH
jgi:hypothetical membrane protein